MTRRPPVLSRRRSARSALVVLLGALLGAGLLGVAGAYWLAPGGGAGSGPTGRAASVTLSPGSPEATLIPGAQTGVVLAMSNPNAFSVHVGSLALDTGQGSAGFTVDASHAGCATSALSYTTQTNTTSGWTVPAKVGAVDGALPVILTNALSMDIGAANACQGASFTVYLAAGP